jgi:hypothetical protein
MKTSVPEGTRLIVTDHEEYEQSVTGAPDGTTEPGPGVCYSEKRLGRKNDFVPTLERILGKKQDS